MCSHSPAPEQAPGAASRRHCWEGSTSSAGKARPPRTALCGRSLEDRASRSPFPKQRSPQSLTSGQAAAVTTVHALRTRTFQPRTQAERGKESPSPFDPSLAYSPIPCQITSGNGAGGPRRPGPRAAQDAGRRAAAQSHSALGDAILARSRDRAARARPGGSPEALPPRLSASCLRAGRPPWPVALVDWRPR